MMFYIHLMYIFYNTICTRCILNLTLYEQLIANLTDLQTCNSIYITTYTQTHTQYIYILHLTT